MIFSKREKLVKLPKLHTPTLSVTESTNGDYYANVSNPSNNGEFAEFWELYKVGNSAPIEKVKVGLRRRITDHLTEGKNEFYVRLTAEGFLRSDASNIVTITI